MSKKKYMKLAVWLSMAVLMTGCTNGAQKNEVTVDTTDMEAETAAEITETESDPTQDIAAQTGRDDAADSETTGLSGETAADGHIDFGVLQEENPDIFAWLYIPGTDIDFPILQSPISDEYYKTHAADGTESEAGALFTEMPNMMNMCDFNTVIHGQDESEDALFSDLHQFENPDFFTEHESFYIYMPDNVLTYEIFAAYYDEESDILRRHDYTTYAGCQSHLDEIYGLRDMTKNQREGWEDLTPYHFLVTLDGTVRDGRQYVVIGVLTQDAAGCIDRVILD